MAIINKQDTDGTKLLLPKGEFGLDDYVAGGDQGRVWIGTGTENLALAMVNDNVDATDTVKGKVELATDAETITGTSITHAVTPAGTAAAIGKVTDGTTPIAFDNTISELTATTVKTAIDELTVLATIPTTSTPTLTYTATVQEGLATDIVITNYDASFTYVMAGNEIGSTLIRVGDTITYTSSDITVDTVVNITVTAQDEGTGYLVSRKATASITVLFFTVLDDTTDSVGADDGILLYQGADMVDTYYDYSADIRIDTQKLKTSKVAYNAIAYTGNGTSQDIVNDIEMNLDGRLVDKVGGQVWVKSRTALANHYCMSTMYGIEKNLVVNGTGPINSGITNSASATGFQLTSNGNTNTNGHNYVSWNQGTTKYTNGYTNHGKFYEVEINPLTGFFQGVYEGSGTSGHEIPHMMGVVPDFFVTKNTTNVAEWQAYVKSEGATKYMVMSGTNAVATSSGLFNDTEPTSTVFTVGTSASINAASSKVYFYGFANTAGMVKVGTYTGTGSAGNAITGLGFQPSYVMTKRTDGVSGWAIKDSSRGGSELLYADTSSAVSNYSALTFDTDGFTLSAGSVVNASGGTYLYIAVADHADFETTLYTGNGGTQDVVTGLNMDWDGVEHARIPGGLSWIKSRGFADGHRLYDTLRGATKTIYSHDTDAETVESTSLTGFNSGGVSVGAGLGVNRNSTEHINWSWGTTHQYKGTTNHGKPYTVAFNPISGFCIVKYTGSGITGHEIPHNLGRALDFVHIKRLDGIATNWLTFTRVGAGPNAYLALNLTQAESSSVDLTHRFTSDALIIDSTVASYNGAGEELIMYGWANSMTQEVIEYTGTGIAGNFINTKKKPGYVMVKRLDSTSHWTIMDIERGEGNTTWANLSSVESTNYGTIFNDSGFIVSGSTAEVNASGGKYLAFIMYDTDEDTNGSEYY